MDNLPTTTPKRTWQKNKARVLAWYSAAMHEFLFVLSPDGRCARCRKFFDWKLEVDHMDGRDWVLTKLNRWSRLALYKREYAAGVRLQALCRSCNAKDGGSRRYTHAPTESTVVVRADDSCEPS